MRVTPPKGGGAAFADAGEAAVEEWIEVGPACPGGALAVAFSERPVRQIGPYRR